MSSPSSSLSQHQISINTHKKHRASEIIHDAVNKLPPASRTPVVKIQSQLSNDFPSQPSTSAPPSQVDLNFRTAPSFHPSSLSTSANIQDSPVFTTDPSQSTWPPSSSSSLPATPAQRQQLQHLQLPPQQDFILCDYETPQPKRQHRQPSRPASQSSASGSASQQIRHHPYQTSPVSQQQHLNNQRVAHIIQETGHNISSSAFTNRFGTAQNPHQFYASSAPSSTVALNQQNQNRATRPPVPLFRQSTGSIHQGNKAKMDSLGNYHVDPAQPLGSRRLQIRSDFSDLGGDFTPFEGGAPTSSFPSPANPPFDMSGSVSSSTNFGTVSPNDLLMTESLMSAPNSTALTALTSPSLYDGSPDFNDSFDVSPNFGSNDFDDGSEGPWFSLFPQNEQVPATSTVAQSPAEQSEELEVVEPTSRRRKSGQSQSRSPPTGRHSSVTGVNSRRRDKPLPPIIVEDPHDTIAMKRARNTLAARKSRERKAMRFEELEEKIAELEKERDHWKQIAEARNGGS